MMKKKWQEKWNNKPGFSGEMYRKTAAVLAAFFLLASFSSCGKQETVEAPELLEPIALTDSYRPVQRRDIGEVKLLNGVVVPEAYPVFSDTPVGIYELKVCPGDHVEEGDVIATGDTRELDQSIRNLKARIEMMTRQKNTSESISRKEAEQQSYLLKASKEVGLQDEVERIEMEIRLEEENQRYEMENLDASIRSLQENLTKLEKDKEKLVFTAPHSGEVTFLKDISSTNYVAGNENIAVISDFQDRYIEVQEKTTKTFEYGNYQEQYILVDGAKHRLIPRPYTTAELSLAENCGGYPPVRFIAENYVGELGATMPLYFSNTNCTDVLAISNDSIYREGDFAYCYVLGEDGQRIRRGIETGNRDLAYTEILSGLTEGEAVFYDNKSALPTKYQEFKVRTKDYSEIFSSKQISLLLTEHDIYTSPWDGSITEAGVKSTEEVEEGQMLYRLKIPVKRGEMADAKNSITDLEENYRNQMNAYNQREAALKEQIAAAGTHPPKAADGDAPEAGAGETDGQDVGTADGDEPEAGAGEVDTEPTREELIEKRDSLYLKERLTADLEILQLERAEAEAQYSVQKEELNSEYDRLSGAGTDGEGVITAREAGVVGQNVAGETNSVYEGMYLFTVSSQGRLLIRVSMPKSRKKAPLPAARPGQTITFTKDGQTYTGKCVAANGDPEHMYLFTRDGKEYLTHSEAYSAGSSEQFFVVLEDEEHYEDLSETVASYNGCLVQGGTPVPAKAIYTEKDAMTDKTSVFVWKVTENGLVKEEVTVMENTQIVDEKLILSGISPGDVIAVE